MKFKKLILVSGILCISLMLSIGALAFLPSGTPSIHLESALTDAVDLHIASAEIGENTVRLYVNYDSYGSYIEIVRPMLVAADSEFTQPFTFMESIWSMEENQFVYTFEFDEQTFGGRRASSIYVRPPVVYVPVEFETVSMPVAVGATMPVALDTSAARWGDPWFSISSVDVGELEIGEFLVSVMVTPYTADYPRLPKLVIDGNPHEVLVTHHRFDHNVEFIFAVFEFLVQADSVDEVYTMLEGAYITVDYAMFRTHAIGAVNAATAFASDTASANDININFVVD